MSTFTLSDYASALARSRLCDEGAVQQASKDYLQATEPARRSAEGFADFVAGRGLVTAWQNSQLLQGRCKGFLLGKYKLLEQLGRGGMAGVYLAEDSLLLRKVALKILPKAHASGPTSHLARFQREAKALAMLHHRNVVRVYDIDVHEDMHFIAMEFIQGVDLQRLVTERGPLNERDVADYVGQAAAGLAHAHEQGLVHRDIKPANLLLDDSGAIKLLDLGVARMADEETSLTVLHDDRMLGTADFIAPEQALNSHTVGPSADVYSLGCTLYFLLTGHAPFHVGTTAERLLAHQMKEPPDLPRARRKAGAGPIDPWLVQLCTRMLAKSPVERPTAAQLHDAMRTRHNEPVGLPRKSAATVPAATPKPVKQSTPPVTSAEKPKVTDEAASLAFIDSRIAAKTGAKASDRRAQRSSRMRGAPNSRQRRTLIAIAAAGLLLVGLGAGGALIAFRALQQDTTTPAIAGAIAGEVDVAQPLNSHDISPRNANDTFPAALPSVRPPETVSGDRFFVVGSSTKYHRAACRHVTAAAREIDAVEAKAKFQPCKVCRPDQ